MRVEDIQRAKALRDQGKRLGEIGEILHYSRSSISIALNPVKGMEERNCEVCGEPFTPTRKSSKYRKTCSNECEHFLRRKLHFTQGPCEYCGKQIVPHRTAPQRFCDSTCSYEWKKGRSPKEQKQAADKFDFRVAMEHERIVQDMKRRKEETLAKYEAQRAKPQAA